MNSSSGVDVIYKIVKQHKRLTGSDHKDQMPTYKKLVLDPRCLKPYYEVNDCDVYIEALSAIESALAEPYITQSEKTVLETTMSEVKKNRFDV